MFMGPTPAPEDGSFRRSPGPLALSRQAAGVVTRIGIATGRVNGAVEFVASLDRVGGLSQSVDYVLGGAHFVDPQLDAQVEAVGRYGVGKIVGDGLQCPLDCPDRFCFGL